MKLKFGKIKEVFNGIFQKFSKNLFLFLILLLALDLVLGGIFFWKYFLEVEKGVAGGWRPIIAPLKINQVSMEKVSGEWQKREKIFKEAAEKQYPDPFRGTISE